jgi:hypothetical protein
MCAHLHTSPHVPLPDIPACHAPFPMHSKCLSLINIKMHFFLLIWLPCYCCSTHCHLYCHLYCHVHCHPTSPRSPMIPLVSFASYKLILESMVTHINQLPVPPHFHFPDIDIVYISSQIVRDRQDKRNPPPDVAS